MNSAEVGFLEWLEGPFMDGLPTFQWVAAPRTAVIVVDLVRGFCDLGPLASNRVDRLISPVAQFLQEAKAQGVDYIFFCCDEHPADSPEFLAFPPHCVVGSAEAELHPVLADLRLGQIFTKGSLNGMLETGLPECLEQHPDIENFVVVGDCTDLCIFQTAIHLRMLANVKKRNWDVVVLANLVDTFDMPREVADRLGAMPHPADLCHRLALYQLRLNGCRVERYSSISA